MTWEQLWSETTFHDRLWDIDNRPRAFVNTQNKFIKVNQALCVLLGYTEHELLEKRWDEISDPTDTPHDQAEVNKLLAGTRQSYAMSKTYFTKNKSPIPITLTVHAFRNEDNVVLFFDSKIEPDKPMRVQIVDHKNNPVDIPTSTLAWIAKNKINLVIAGTLLAGMITWFIKTLFAIYEAGANNVGV